jgi:Homeobox KN domain
MSHKSRWLTQLSDLPPSIVENFGVQQADEATTNLDLSNFAKWIPRYSKPDAPCDYCKSRHLECWFTFENQTSCSACCALFRPCSFTVEDLHPVVLMDTLHVVQEDVVQSNGCLTGVKALRSWDRTPLDNPQTNEDERPTRKTGTRFPREAVTILKKWVDIHRDHPYPTEDEKDDLRQRTGLSVTQISNWLANSRRRSKIKRCRGVSPSIRSPVWSTDTEGIAIPGRNRDIMNDGKSWDIMNPLERWKASPPDNEPARLADIANAVAHSEMRSSDSSISRSNSRNYIESSAESSSFSVTKAPSITSLDTGRSDSQLSSGSISNLSAGSSRSLGSRNSYRSLGSGSRRDHRRRRRANANATPSTQRPFQCTFCTDTFRTKFDWMRHEKSLHLSLEKYICAPLGAIIASPSRGETTCVFCGESNPTTEHLDIHNYRECCEKSIAGRTFYRKDHLSQHLRLVHGCKLIPSMDSWKSEATYIRCRCGFCGEEFTSWTERCDHLAKHFRSGAKMRDWKGCRGFDENVATLVKNAMPAYLIWQESNSMVPFSASNEGTQQAAASSDMTNLESDLATESYLEQLSDWNRTIDCSGDLVPVDNALQPDLWTISPELIQSGGIDYTGNLLANRPRISTCWEILTIRLGLFVKEKLQAGILPTDGMLQRQARWILYESDDNWNQTAADNPEWLELFKKAHGLPSTSTDSRVDMMEDLGAGIGELTFDSLLDGSWEASAENGAL